MTSETTPPPQAGVGRYGLCAGCIYFTTFLEEGRCVPGDACIRAHSGRQIDRFLRRNPGESADYLADLFWERRAIAARYAPLDAIIPLAGDCDEVVRRVVAGRLPADKLARMATDTDRDVRLAVAARLPEGQLSCLVDDPDYLVRATVARRLPHGKLLRLAHDSDREVRKVIAQRLPPFALHLLAADAEAEVRALVAERALPDVAATLLHDTEWWVRLAAVAGAPLELLPAIMTDDPEPEVREAARERLKTQTPETSVKETS